MSLKDAHILLIQPLVGIGDMLWHKPWIDNLSKNNKITLLAKPTTKSETFFKKNKNVKIISLKRSMRGKRAEHDGVLGFIKLIKLFKLINPKIAMILHHSFRYAAACKISGIQKIYGYGLGNQKFLINCGKILPNYLKNNHAIDRIKFFSKQNGFGLENPIWSIDLTTKQKMLGSKFLYNNNLIKNKKIVPFLVIGVGAMNKERQWGATKFSKLIKLLIFDKRYYIVIVGGNNEYKIINEIKSSLNSNCLEKISVADGSLEEVVSVMSFASGYIGNDTSFLNIMACLNIPSLGLFSNSKPLNYNKNLIKLDILKEDDYGKTGIIEKLNVRDVYDKYFEIWKK